MVSWKPCLLSGSLGNVAAREEIFGPVAYMTTFDQESNVSLANDTDYGSQIVFGLQT